MQIPTAASEVKAYFVTKEITAVSLVCSASALYGEPEIVTKVCMQYDKIAMIENRWTQIAVAIVMLVLG